MEKSDQTKRKSSAISSVSDLDITNEDSTQPKEGKQTDKIESKKQKRKSAKLQAKKAELNLDLSSPIDKNKDKDKEKTKEVEAEKNKEIKESHPPSSIEKQLAAINEQLRNVIKKSDSETLKNMIKETMLEMKDAIMESLVKRIEIIEGEIHDKAVENERLKKQIGELNKKLDESKEQQLETEKNFEKETNKISEMMNEHEQYSRRNNIRIMGLPGDETGETANNTIEKALKLFESKLNVNLTQRDIDVAHRLGEYKEGRNRQVIMKFVNGHEKSRIMADKKKLKNSGTSIFEDLSRLNSEVLARKCHKK